MRSLNQTHPCFALLKLKQTVNFLLIIAFFASCRAQNPVHGTHRVRSVLYHSLITAYLPVNRDINCPAVGKRSDSRDSLEQSAPRLQPNRRSSFALSRKSGGRLRTTEREVSEPDQNDHPDNTLRCSVGRGCVWRMNRQGFNTAIPWDCVEMNGDLK